MLVVMRNETRIGDVIRLPAAKQPILSESEEATPPWGIMLICQPAQGSDTAGLVSNYRKLLEKTEISQTNNKQWQLQGQRPPAESSLVTT